MVKIDGADRSGVGVDSSQFFHRHFERKIIGSGEARAIENGALRHGRKEIGELRHGVVLQYSAAVVQVVAHVTLALLIFRRPLSGDERVNLHLAPLTMELQLEPFLEQSFEHQRDQLFRRVVGSLRNDVVSFSANPGRTVDLVAPYKVGAGEDVEERRVRVGKSIATGARAASAAGDWSGWFHRRGFKGGSLGKRGESEVQSYGEAVHLIK